MKNFLHNFFIGGLLKNNERSWKKAGKLFPIFFIIILVINFEYLNLSRIYLGEDKHSLTSIEHAYNDVFCGQISRQSPKQISHIDLLKPINNLFFNNESERLAYCSNLTYTTLNEPSLSHIYSFLFKLFPSISLKSISNIFILLKVCIVCLFSFLLLRLGLSMFYIILVNIALFFFVYSALLEKSAFSTYTFFIPMYLCYISLLVIYLVFLKKYHYKFIPFGFLIGAYAAFYMNFRTSSFPVILYSTLLISIFIYLSIRNDVGSKIKSIIFTVLCLSVMYGGFHSYMHVFLKPLLIQAEANQPSNYLYHSVAHPLVLALGITTSDLATREGIKWEDGVGTSLAQKIDPSADYLSKTYEKALFIYYLKLWFYYPDELFDIYNLKFKNYTTLGFSHYVNPEKTTTFNTPFLQMIVLFTNFVNTSWKAWAILLLSFSLLGVFHKRMNEVGLFFALSIVGTCMLLLLEAIIIFHQFSVTHFPVVNLLFIMIILYYVQMATSYLYKIFSKLVFF